MGKAVAAAPRTLEMALARAADMIDSRPEQALAEAEAILARAPGLPPAELLAGQALRRLGKTQAAQRRLAALPLQGGGAFELPGRLHPLGGDQLIHRGDPDHRVTQAQSGAAHARDGTHGEPPIHFDGCHCAPSPLIGRWPED
jgi:hypothetical protein